MKQEYKDNINRTIITIIIFVIAYFIDITLLGNTEIYFSDPICPVLGLIFGPFGAIGVLIGNFLTYGVWESFQDGDFSIYLIAFSVFQFLMAYIPYKLWYTLKKSNRFPVKLNNVNNVIKFIFIIFLTSLIYLILFTTFEQYWNQGLKGLIDSIQWTLGFFVLSIFCGIVGLTIVDFPKISNYKPKSSNLNVSTNYFYILLILIIITGLINVIYVILYQKNLFQPYFGIILLSLTLLFCFIPIKGKIKDNSKYFNKIGFGKEGIKFSNNSLSLIERFLLIFQVVIIILAFFVAFISYYGILSDITHQNTYFSMLTYMNLVVLFFYAPGIIFLYYVEKNITQPLEIISNTAKNYVNKSSNELLNIEKISNLLNEYVGSGGEIGDLAFSYYTMIEDIEYYIKNLESLTTEKERIKTELDIAENIQKSFIPTNFDEINNKNITLFGLMEPAKEVGGDFYDFFLLDSNRLAIVIADVSGKGIPAALFMVITKTLLKNSLETEKDLITVFNKVNNELFKNNNEDMFVTAWVGILDLDTGKLNFINAGHNSPIIRTNNKYEFLNTKPNFVLGGLENIKYTSHEITLNHGDRVLLYTDGVTEANYNYHEFFGKKRLIEILNNSNNESIKSEVNLIKDQIYNFADKKNQFDDITLLYLEYKK